MSSFIEFTTIALVLVYIGVAAWKICTCRTISGSIGVSCAFLIGGFFILPVAYSVLGGRHCNRSGTDRCLLRLKGA